MGFRSFCHLAGTCDSVPAGCPSLRYQLHSEVAVTSPAKSPGRMAAVCANYGTMGSCAAHRTGAAVVTVGPITVRGLLSSRASCGETGFFSCSIMSRVMSILRVGSNVPC